MDFANWKRIRTAIEHENQLINQRFTWLLVLNGLIVTAFGSIFVHVPPGTIDSLEKTLTQNEKLVLSGLAFCGILFSVFSHSAMRSAFEQHDKLKLWWEDHKLRKAASDHPPICGEHPKFLFLRLHYYYFPIIFIVIWMTLFLVVLFTELLRVLHYVIIPFCFGGAVIGLLYLGVIWERKHTKNRPRK
jgi:hypothetical protein